MVLHDHEVRRDEIPQYLAAERLEKITFWSRCKYYGLPFSGGWAEQPAVLMDIIETLDQAAQKQQEQRAKHASKRPR